MTSRVEWWARAAVGAAVVLACYLVVHRLLFSPVGRVILHDETAPWIMTDTPVSGSLQRSGRKRAPVNHFVATFNAPQASGPIHLRVRAFGTFKVFLNGQHVPLGQPRNWKRFAHADVSRVEAGSNTIRVEVRNLHGPALLSFHLEGNNLALKSGPHWSADRLNPPTKRAVTATDVRPHPEAAKSEVPSTAMAKRWLPLSVLFLAGCLVFLILSGVSKGHALWPALPVALGLMAVAWLALFALKFRTVPLFMGFDAGAHLGYVEFMRMHKRLPLATDGWSMYHPPLFYLLSCAVLSAARQLGAESFPVVLKLVPFLSGFATVCVSVILVRRLVPEVRSATVYATLFAGLLPMNLYVSAYFSNEGLHACLAGAGLLGAVDLLLRNTIDPKRTALLSALFGLALLTKVTAVVVAAVVGVFVVLAIVIRHRSRPGGAALLLCALVLPVLGIAGWFYARNAVHFGTPLMGNWDLPGTGLTWWSPPGFHTPDYYLSFGASLHHPYLSAFASFWDAIYSTLWGDGLIGGYAAFSARPGWNYDFMSAGYVLALPATLLIILGGLRACSIALRDTDARRRSAHACLVVAFAATGFAVFYMTLALPYFGQAKAFYMLSMTPLVTLFFTLGVCSVDRWLTRRGGQIARTPLFGWLGALFGCFYLAFAV